MKPDTANLAALIGSRICHDLISPVGAVGNGLELIQMTNTLDEPEMQLITESVEAARLRILFFRIAYGLAVAGQMVGREEVVSLLDGLFKDRRVKAAWRLTQAMERSETRLAFLALQCVEAALPYGGQITVSHDGTRWCVEGTGERLKVDQALWNNLAAATPHSEVAPSDVQFALLPLLLRDAGRVLNANIDAAKITIRF
ncbi:MAG: histidine phosphotransferase [Rhodobacteraceae bacterium]|nr:histidine phosphotransferase [Paracoccaceae bacterium]